MIKTFSGGLLDSNVYVVYDGNEAMIIDCGVDTDTICRFIKEQNLKVKYIVLSHGHHDHVINVGEYLDAFKGAVPICHSEEIKVLTDAEANVSSLSPSRVSIIMITQPYPRGIS